MLHFQLVGIAAGLVQCFSFQRLSFSLKIPAGRAHREGSGAELHLPALRPDLRPHRISVFQRVSFQLFFDAARSHIEETETTVV